MKIEQTYRPSFSGYKSRVSRNIEKILIGKSDTVLGCTDVYSQVQNKIRPERCCGVGMHASVYKIDDYYVVKVPSKTDSNDFNVVNDGVVPQFFGKLKTYFGETIFKLKKFYVLKNVSNGKSHIPVGIPLEMYKSMSWYELSEPQNRSKLVDYYKQNILPIVAKLPQKSFDNVAKDCSILNEMADSKYSYFFDYANPNNFVIVGDKIRVIDTIYKDYDCRARNAISDLLSVFLNNMGYYLTAKYSADMVAQRREILKKVIHAGIKYKLPIEPLGSKPYTYRKSLNLVDLKKVCDDDFINVLETISKIPDDKTRLCVLDSYIEKLFSKN